MRVLVAIPALLLPLVAGCLEGGGTRLPDEPMCYVDSDCNQARGEVCADDICWGDPPDSQLGAVLIAPDGRSDLVRSEVAGFDIAPDGAITGLAFADSVVLSGRVMLACAEVGSASCDPEVSVAAQIQARRKSKLRGGPTYKRTVSAKAGVGSGSTAFSLRLPRTGPDDEPYEIIIVPDDGTTSDDPDHEPPAQLAPPMRFSLEATGDQSNLSWVLGQSEQLKVVRGRVVDAANRGLAEMRVSALGRWTPFSVPERASSIATTDEEGWFKIRVPVEMLDTFDLVVRPAPGTRAPSLRKLGVLIPDPEEGQEVEVGDLRMPSYAEPATFVVPVQGRSGSGGTVPVAGAEARLTTILVDDLDTLATYTASGLTDEAGEARLELIPGGGQQNRLYAGRVVPQTSSKHASLFDVEVSVGLPNPNGASYLPGLLLSPRVALTGQVITDEGFPVAGATVSARISPLLKWTLDDDGQITVDGLQLPSATADGAGVFMLWLDAALVGHEALYDLDIVPPAGSRAPRWTLREVEAVASNGGDSIDLGSLTLPPASHARGPVRDPAGEPVPGAEVRVYELMADESFCDGGSRPSSFDADDCVPPAILRGLWHSRDDGEVWMVLPRP